MGTDTNERRGKLRRGAEMTSLGLLLIALCACPSPGWEVSYAKKPLPAMKLDSSDPPDGADAVPVDAALTLDFDYRPLLKSAKRKISLVRGGNGTKVKCGFEVPSAGFGLSSKLVLTPVRPLDPGRKYRIRIAEGLRGADLCIYGCGYAKSRRGYTVRFTTASSVPLTAEAPTSHRTGHTSTLLPSGRILVIGGLIGGRPTAATEIRDPYGERSEPGPRLPATLAFHTATLLPDGTVLIVGGLEGSDQRPSSRAWIIDPSSSEPAFPVRSLRRPRAFHDAELVDEHLVVIRGGTVPEEEAYLLPTASQFSAPLPRRNPDTTRSTLRTSAASTRSRTSSKRTG